MEFYFHLLFKTGKFNHQSYVIMEYIEGTLLSEVPEEEIDFYLLGKLLREMHKIKGIGFGRVNKFGKVGHYMTFEAYVKKQFLDGKKHNENNLEEHLKKIKSYYKKSHKNIVFCHMDFSTHNIIERYGKYYVLDFGHEAGFNYNLFDIAKFVVNDFSYDKMEEILNGYGLCSEERKILRSFIYIVGIRKIASWKKRGFLSKSEKFKNRFPDIPFE